MLSVSVGLRVFPSGRNPGLHKRKNGGVDDEEAESLEKATMQRTWREGRIYQELRGKVRDCRSRDSRTDTEERSSRTRAIIAAL
jgi:hypothetical protein